MLKSFIQLIFSLLFITSCEDPKLFMEYRNFTDRWAVNDKAVFNINSISKQEVNLFIYVRNDYRYPFSNLFLIASLKEGNYLVARDTLEYAMSDEKGAWLGSGFLELKESKLLWKESFQVKGEKPITAEIEHAVRFNGNENGIDALEGIVGVGLAIEAIRNQNE